MKTKEFIREIEDELLSLYTRIGCDRPDGHDAILEFVSDEIWETRTPDDWSDQSVATAFRHWMESKIE